MAIIAGEEAERLARDMTEHTERPAQLVAMVRSEEVVPTTEEPRPLAQP